MVVPLTKFPSFLLQCQADEFLSSLSGAVGKKSLTVWISQRCKKYYR